jgi:hypothetical protein
MCYYGKKMVRNYERRVMTLKVTMKLKCILMMILIVSQVTACTNQQTASNQNSSNAISTVEDLRNEEDSEKNNATDKVKDDTSEIETVTSDNDEFVDNHMVIQEQSFDVELDLWGRVRFVSCKPDKVDDFGDAYFYLVKDKKVVYTLPYYYDKNIRSNGILDSVVAVAFKDINKDGLKDIIIIITYNTGAGPQGMLPFSEARLFIAGDKEFTLDRKLTDAVNEGDANTDITSITDYIKSQED